MEKDPVKLDSEDLEAKLDVNPIFKNMTAKVSEKGAKNTLIHYLPLGSTMDMLLEPSESAVIEEEENEIAREIQNCIEEVKDQVDLDEIHAFTTCNLNMLKSEEERQMVDLDRGIYDTLMFNKEEEEEIDSIGAVEYGDNASIAEVEEEYGEEEPVEEPPVMDVDVLSMLKAEDIKNYVMSFGDGNQRVLKQQEGNLSFLKRFENLEKDKKSTKKPKKGRKEVVLVEFGVENEIESSDIFEEKSLRQKNKKGRSKAKLKKKIRLGHDYDIRQCIIKQIGQTFHSSRAKTEGRIGGSSRRATSRPDGRLDGRGRRSG